MGIDEDRATRAVRFPLSLKLAAFAGFLTVACAIALGLVLTDISRRTLTAMGRDYRLAVGEDIAQTIRMESRSAETALLTAAELLSEPQMTADAKLPIVLSYVGTTTAFDQVAVYSADGSLIDVVKTPDASAEPWSEKLDSELVAQLADSTGVRFEGTRYAPTARARLFASIRDRDGQTTGFIATLADLSGVQQRIDELGEQRLRSAAARIVVIDGDGRVIAASDETPVGASLKEEPMFGHLDIAFEKRIELATEIERDNETWMGSVLPLGEQHWAVAIEVPASVAYAAVDQMRRSIWIAVLIALALATLASLLGARRIAAPLARLSEFGRRLAAREFDARTNVDSADEVGVLADVLRNAAQDLKASEQTIRTETAIRTDLGRYLPRELVDAIVERKQSLELGGIRSPMTVMFADVVRFTPLCEKLPPDEVVELLNELFTIITEIVFRHGGTVDKFIGDSVMAFWGAPQPCEDHADRALHAADDILRWLEAGNDTWVERYGAKIEIAIGINSGSPVVGNIGSSTRMEYTAIGECVNVAARLEALARPNQVLTTTATRASAEAFDFNRVGSEVLTEGSREVDIWEVLL